VILFPALALMAAAGLRQAQGLGRQALQRSPVLPSGWSRALRGMIAALPAALLLYLLLIDLRIHPYYLDYYNELVGGPSGVYQRHLLELAWWNEGTDEAVAYLNQVAPPGRVGLLLEPIPREPSLRRDLKLISRDQFSARWRGKLDAPRAGEYQLIAISDDGVRVWVDQRLVIDHWQRRPVTEDRAMVTLRPGLHDLQVEYFQDRGQAAIRLLWEPPGGGREAIPAGHLLYAEPGSGQLKRGGLWGEYFRRVDLTEPWVSRVDPQLNIDVSRAFSYWMAPPDYLLVNAPYEWLHPGPVDLTRYTLQYTVRAAGAPLVKVYRRMR
ncbi:MAG: hypothetical protein HYY85_14425, partial [Deltaproteobacteria bacterium]|nr:hypothetical protein [Deltaproteobacteria bacterium]